MRELFYLKDNLGILNYTKSYPMTYDEVLSADSFKELFRAYLKAIAKRDMKQYRWLCAQHEDHDVAIAHMTHVLKALCIFQMDEVDSPYLDEKNRMLYFVEDFYNFWRHINRFSLVTTRTANGMQLANFIESDARFNQLILSLYRTIEERLQGKKNNVYRQLNAGTNACLVTRDVAWDVPDGYEALAAIPFIDSLMLRTPLILHPKTNKRVGSFEETTINPIVHFENNYNEWFCYPAKIGEMLAFLYFHRDFIASGISLGNLFELANEVDYGGKQPDLICLFGVQDGTKEDCFFYDETTQIDIGKVAYRDQIEYFGYIKKMSLTLHNLAAMRKKKLPIHGSMVNITMKDGSVKGVMFIGDSGAGKSETIEALRMVGDDYIAKMDVIFDDMGSISYVDEHLYAQGTEIGAFIRLDDLEKGTAYRDMDRSIFMNPESSNARVILPATTYEDVVAKHKIDMILYANNYSDSFGLHAFQKSEEAMQTFVEGKRFALGTTHESGITTTYFANPFGPMQKQSACDKLLKTMFDAFAEQDVFIGEIFTRLGVDSNDKVGIKEAALALLQFIADGK